MQIGGGFYQASTVASALATGVEVAIVHLNHAVAMAIRQANPWALIVGRFDDGNDAAQVDMTRPPEAEADRWFGIIQVALSAVPRGTYSAVVGICENWPSPGDTKGLRWRAAFEAHLCRRVQTEIPLPYAALSCPVANLEPDELVLFEEVFERAVLLNYHGYLPSHATTLAGDTGPWHLWRPLELWLPECRRLGLRMPSIFLAEVGTYLCWQQEGMSADEYSRLCIGVALAFGERCRLLGVPFAGACGFGFGTVGVFDRWRQDGTEAIYATATAAEEPPEEDPVTLAEQYPVQYQQWVAAGGVTNNFRAHLLGIGALAPTKADVPVLAGQVKAATDQLTNVVARLPFA